MAVPVRPNLVKLLRWYKQEGRDLPWRHTRDPYRILVSEIMLQQTQVKRVLVFYQRWLRQFPGWDALAEASNAEVIRAWSGLGYNRRALVLRDIARQVRENGIPKSRDEWQQMKGIGPYTSAALAAFSGGQPVLPIDTNIRRLLGRLYLGKTFPTPSVDDRLRWMVEPVLRQVENAPDAPQAMFDLANAYCLKRPTCATCPLRATCLAAPKFLSGRVRVLKRSVAKGNERIYPGKKYPDRIYRGRILRLVQARRRGLPRQGLGQKIDPSFQDGDNDWLENMIVRLERDGLLRRKGESLSLL